MKKIIWLFVFLSQTFSCSPKDSSKEEAALATDNLLPVETFGAVTDAKATAIKMTDGSGKWNVELSWKIPPNSTIKKFVIQRGDESGKYVDTYETDKSPYVINGLNPETTHFFTVSVVGVVNNAEKTYTSAEFSIKIPLDGYTEKPGSFSIQATKVNGTEVQLSWDEADRASYYIIQKGISSGSYPTLVTKLATSPYVDRDTDNATQLHAGKTLYYIVIAVNSAGSTNANQEKSVAPDSSPTITLAFLPGAFNILTGTPGNSQANLSWEPASGADSYKVKYGTTSGSYPEIFSTTTTNTSLTVTGLVNGTTYYFQVVALNGGGSTNTTNEKSVILPAPNFSALGQLRLKAPEPIEDSSYINNYLGFTDSLGNYYVVTSVESGELDNANPQLDTSQHGYVDLIFYKYNSSGEMVWARQIAGDDYAQSQLYATAFTSDSQGNIIATFTIDDTSSFQGIPINDPFATNGGIVKLSSSGQLLWSKVIQYNVELDTLATDSQNNIIAASPDFMMVKYDSSGNTVWTGTNNDGVIIYPTETGPDYDGSTTNYRKNPRSIAFSTAGDGSFYVLHAMANTYNTVYFSGLEKFNSSGTKQWLYTYGTSDNDPARFTSSEMAVQHSDTYGDELFIGIDYSRKVNFDSKSKIGTTEGFLLKARGSDGSLVWSKQLAIVGGELGVKNIILHNNTIYVTGLTKAAFPGQTQVGIFDYFVTSYNNSDVANDVSQQWLTQFGAASASVANAYSLYNNRIELKVINTNLVISSMIDAGIHGNTLGNTADNYDYFFAKHLLSDGSLQTGTFQTDVDLVNPGITYTESAIYSMKRDNAGNLYVTGSADYALLYDPSNEFTGDEDGFIAKYDFLGNLQWVKDTAIGKSVDFDQQGNLYVSGETNAPIYDPSTNTSLTVNGWYAGFLMKFTPQGERIWSRIIQGDTNGTIAKRMSVGLTGSGNSAENYIYVVGDFEADNFDGFSRIGDVDAFMAKFDTSGNKVWSKTFAVNAAASKVEFNSVKASNDGMIYVAGDNSGGPLDTINGTTTIPSPPTQIGIIDSITLKFNDAGDLLWTKHLGVSGKEIYASEVDIDTSNNLYVAGKTQVEFKVGDVINGDVGFAYNAFLIKYDSANGNELWDDPVRFGASTYTTYGADKPHPLVSLLVDSARDKVYLTGSTELAIDNMPSGVQPLIGDHDFYIAQFSASTGESLWASTIGFSDPINSNSILEGYCMALDDNGDLFVGGDTTKDMNTGNGLLWSEPYSSSGFIIRYDRFGNKL